MKLLSSRQSSIKYKHYCDSCVLIGFLSQEADKFEQCKSVLESAQLGKIELYTSAFTMAEVVKIKSDLDLDIEKQEEIINNLFANDWMRTVNFERETAEISRYIVRKYGLKPFDSLHLATAIRMQVDYFDTTDYDTLIKKLPQQVSYSPNLQKYPDPVIIQKPFVHGYQPSIFS